MFILANGNMFGGLGFVAAAFYGTGIAIAVLGGLIVLAIADEHRRHMKRQEMLRRYREAVLARRAAAAA